MIFRKILESWHNCISCFLRTFKQFTNYSFGKLHYFVNTFFVKRYELFDLTLDYWVNLLRD